MKTNIIRLIAIIIFAMLIALILSVIPPFSSLGQTDTMKKIGQTVAITDVNKTVITTAKKQVSQGIKKIMEERQQKDALIAKLKADNSKLCNEKAQLKEDRDNAIIDKNNAVVEKNKLKAQLKVVDASIKQYLSDNDKSLVYNYSSVKKDTAGSFEFYNNLKYSIFPNKKDTAVIIKQDTLIRTKGFLGLGHEKFKPYKKNQ